MEVKDHHLIHIHQVFEPFEFLGFETRNKYSIHDENELPIGFAAEQSTGWMGALVRHIFGHWRSFDLCFFNQKREVILKAHHPFRFFFECLEVTTAEGRSIGVWQRKFSLFSKKFVFEGRGGRAHFEIYSPFWKIWTFPITKRGLEVASVQKQWSGLLTEMMTDKDQFRVQFGENSLNEDERWAILAVSILLDLVYFEDKANRKFLDD